MAYPIVTTYGEVVVNTVAPHAPTTTIPVLPPQVQAVVNKSAPVLPPTQVTPPPRGGGIPHPLP